MTLQKFRLTYLLVVVLSVTTVYAIADFNQGTPLELSDAQMQQLRGQDWKFECDAFGNEADCDVGCVHDAAGAEAWIKMQPGGFKGPVYRCVWTGNVNDFCNLSNYGTFCAYNTFTANCVVQIGTWNDMDYLDCEP